MTENRLKEIEWALSNGFKYADMAEFYTASAVRRMKKDGSSEEDIKKVYETSNWCNITTWDRISDFLSDDWKL